MPAAPSACMPLTRGANAGEGVRRIVDSDGRDPGYGAYAGAAGLELAVVLRDPHAGGEEVVHLMTREQGQSVKKNGKMRERHRGVQGRKHKTGGVTRRGFHQHGR